MVMLILPVAFTGALFALPLTGRDLSILALVSIIMLAGTVVNSSIILVEYIKIRRSKGESREEAILHACPLRVRPILMTTLTTVIAMIPMALGIGGDQRDDDRYGRHDDLRHGHIYGDNPGIYSSVLLSHRRLEPYLPPEKEGGRAPCPR